MRLRSILVTNFGCIGDPGLEVEIDKIVVLIGQNNVGKSTLLDAYEALAGVGSPLPLRVFRDYDQSNQIEIAATFGDVTAEDLEVVGAKYHFVDQRYGDSLRVKWVWTSPEAKGAKFSWDPQKQQWAPGGMGGWDTLIASRVPIPLRVRPTDDAATTEAQVVEILTSAAKAAIKADEGRAAEVLRALKDLTSELAKEVGDQIRDATARINKRLDSVFPQYLVEFAPEVGKFEPEKAIGTGSYLKIQGPGQKPVALTQQGAGLRRTFLWTALGTLADLGRVKTGKATIAADRPRILLIEEPEAFLHPPLVRAAREALYDLAGLPEWQVIATSHSPVFIDVSKPHTTIVRIARPQGCGTQVFSTERATFSDEERENLRAIRACHPTVNEFFFADEVWLVEGETEHAVFGYLLERSANPRASQVAIVNCLGKANIPLFGRILNQFGTPYVAIHDADQPRILRNGKLQTNPMWTMNETIRKTVTARDPCLPASLLLGHVPDFERQYLGSPVKAEKPYLAVRIVSSPKPTAESTRLANAVEQLLSHSHPSLYEERKDLEQRVLQWVKDNGLLDQAEWHLALADAEETG